MYPFKQSQLGMGEVQNSGESKMMDLPALQAAEGVSASVLKAGGASIIGGLGGGFLNYEIFKMYKWRII